VYPRRPGRNPGNGYSAAAATATAAAAAAALVLRAVQWQTRRGIGRIAGGRRRAMYGVKSVASERVIRRRR